MAINLDYTPYAALTQGFYNVGQGQAAEVNQQRQFENSLRANQQLMQQQEMAQRAGLAQQQMAQQAYQRGMDREADFYKQQQYGQQQAYVQNLLAARQENLARYQQSNNELDNITMLEKQGFQYSPEQQMRINRLNADLDSVMNDEAVNPQQRSIAQSQFLMKRSTIRPTAPPPKPRQEVFDESLVRFTHPDGTEVWGTMGERNGVPTFDPIENPAEKNKQMEAKAALDQQKFEFQQQQGQAKIEQQIQKMQLDAMQFEMKAQQQQVAAEEKFKQTQLNNFNAAYLKHLTQLNSLKPPKMDEASNQMVGEPVEVQQKRLRDGFKNVYGKLMLEVAPDVAAEYGLEAPPPQSFKDAMWQATDENAILGNEGPMLEAPEGFGQKQRQPPVQQQGPDPRIERAKAAAEAALLAPSATETMKEKARQFLEQLRQQGL